MNNYFRLEQPWFLLLTLFLPLFWLIGSRFQRPPAIRFAAARIFEARNIRSVSTAPE